MNFSNTASANPNLILGYAVGLTQSDVRLFCESAAISATTQTDLFLFGSKFQPTAIPTSRLNIRVIPTANIWQGIIKDSLRIRWACAYITSKCFMRSALLSIRIFRKLFGGDACVSGFHSNWLHPALSRYLVYHDFLSSNAHLYNSVLISDVRDVYFQRDPFVDLDKEFVTFLEIKDSTCGGRINRRWINSTYGQKMAASMNDERVICSGISMGSYSRMIKYLSHMSNEVARRGCIPYADQGIHNVLIRKKAFSASLLANADGLVLTAAGEKSVEDFRIAEDIVVTRNDSPFALVHQYDRHAQLTNAISRQHARRMHAIGR